MFRSTRFLFLLVLAVFLPQQLANGQTFDERFDDWPVDLKINGRVALAGSLSDLAPLKELGLRFGKTDKLGLLSSAESTEELKAKYEALLTVPADRIVAHGMTDNCRGQLEELLQSCQVVCWQSDAPVTTTQAEDLNESQGAIQEFLAEGGTLVVIGPAATLFARYRVAAANEDGESAKEDAIPEGVNAIPDSLLVIAAAEDSSRHQRLLKVLANRPRTVGIVLDENTLLDLSGRKMRTFGQGKATFLLASDDHHPARIETIQQRSRRGQPPERWLIDLTEWRRDAIDRTLEPFPPESPAPPQVENGTLIIVGGGRQPKGIMNRFLELAGGPENARLVYVPCSERDRLPDEQYMVALWNRMGVKNATFIHTKDRKRANEDDQFLAPLEDATGIWFGGGRQWNFSDSYYGTKAHKLMKRVLERGGVIGGSSAGASIQARYMARGTPIGNSRIMAPGYERGGLGFISGVAIDQHFSQRGRQKDMTQLMTRHPQLLGLGIDETTALVVQKSVGEVIGQGKVHFYDRRVPVVPGEPDFVALPAGSRYDLVARRPVEETEE